MNLSNEFQSILAAATKHARQEALKTSIDGFLQEGISIADFCEALGSYASKTADESSDEKTKTAFYRIAYLLGEAALQSDTPKEKNA